MAVLTATLTVAIADYVGVLERLELDAYDALTRATPDLGRDERLLIVGLDESDMSRYGHPISDETLARLIAGIRSHEPSVIALGLYRNIDYPPGTAMLAEQLSMPGIVGKRFIGNDPVDGQVPAPAALAREKVGFSDLVIDPDGVLRRALLYVGGDPGYFSFALRTVLAASPDADGGFRVGDEALDFGAQEVARLTSHSGGYADADAAGYQTLLRFRSRHQPADVVNAGEVLEGRVPTTQIEGRIVLIGETAASAGEEFYTPYSAALEDEDFAMSRVLVQAQIVSQLLDIVEGKPAQFRFLGRAAELAWLAAWAALAALIAWSMRHPVLTLLSTPVVPLILAVLGWWAVPQLFWPPLVAPALAAILASLFITVGRSLRRTTHDAVTGLPGRTRFLGRLRGALAHTAPAPPVAVAVFDLERFGVINKAMGHGSGDRLLALVADRLRGWLGDDRNLARLGGDEFVVLFRGVDASAIEERIRGMRDMLAEPVTLDGRSLRLAASVGVAFAGAEHRRDPELLVRDAHTAMYRAKARKEVPLEIFSRDMGDQAVARLDLESDLLKGLDNEEFFLVYQPVVRLVSGELNSMEALLRWQSPHRGLVGPGSFIPILEETGMIVPLGAWVLETACRQLADWREAHPGLDLKVNVNLSGRQINEPNLDRLVAGVLNRHGLPANALQLEFTESMIMQDVASTNELMTALRSLGVGLAIDDFGTGYSSLSYLHRFPADTLKIDRAFVDNLTDNKEDKDIVHTIITLGHRLDMTLVAEGIESADQAQILHQAGCQYAQGYYYSPPLSAGDASEMIRTAAVNGARFPFAGSRG